MKYVLVIPDGAADEPIAELGQRSPMAAAHTPTMDALASRGKVGLTNHVPPNLPPGSEVACMSLLGYDPLVYFTGRAPLEAAAKGISLGPDDWAVRCNLVTIREQIMEDFTAGHVSDEEAASLLVTAQTALHNPAWEFVPGVSYRNLLLWRGDHSPFTNDSCTIPPHDLIDKSVVDSFPRGSGSRELTEIMSSSAEWFADHPVNVSRRASGKLPATHVWLWGLGRSPTLESFVSRYGINGTMITAVDLLRGLASLVGWKRREVVGATGYLDTDYAAKGRAAIDELRSSDFVCVHVEAPDEASHEGNVRAKVESLEKIDALIVSPLYEALHSMGDYRILICPDHPTFIRLKTHSRGDVPFLISGTGIPSTGATAYHETAAAGDSQRVTHGWHLMGEFLGRPLHLPQGSC
ncbi:MAG: cofactor-independent phosphoglycerate mutase [Planctomycetaceae bacterium]|nr:MAG: cofactor-independent phosphoglycerate mutase [Planctomycetaceae bacterium]